MRRKKKVLKTLWALNAADPSAKGTNPPRKIKVGRMARRRTYLKGWVV
jgi:hypothetical protein